MEKDSDRDGLSDAMGASSGLNVRDRDSDNDGAPDGLEDKIRNGEWNANETDPCEWDTDADGLGDGVEDANRNGVCDPGETDPVLWDTDNDGYGDLDEIWAGYNPLDGASTPAIVCVDPVGECPGCIGDIECYSSIQPGVDSAGAEAGKTTVVKMGQTAYEENISVSGPVRLVIESGPVPLDGP